MSKKIYSNAVILLLNKDSSLVSYSRSNNNGFFLMDNIDSGYYRLVIRHALLAEYFFDFRIEFGKITDLGNILVYPRGVTLEPIIVTPRSFSLRMKGDTLGYNVGNLKLKINATVEDLLRQLPGVRIDANGNIIINGEQVQRILVDGEDFLGGDPTNVTRNLTSDMISKVQIFNKKSKQSEFTGIDDGQKTKTLNLVLKDDRRNGYFGKFESGGSPNNFYNLNGLVGGFQGHRQMALLGIMANNGSTGFNGLVDDKGASLNLVGGTNDPLGASAGGGIPIIVGIGGHYADRWNKEMDHISGNYQFGTLTTRPFSTVINEQILPDSIYLQKISNRSVNHQYQHSASGEMEFPVDSLSEFLISVGGGSMTGHNALNSQSVNYFNDTLVNNSVRNIFSDVTNESFRSRVYWKVQSKYNRDRVFSVLTNFGILNNVANGYLHSLDSFFLSNGRLLSFDSVDQRKVIESKGENWGIVFNYTEPLWKNTILAMSSGISIDKRMSLLGTYDRGDGKYDAYIDSLSNHYQNKTVIQQNSFGLQVKGKNYYYMIGADMNSYSYKEINIFNDSAIRYRYFIFSPRANLVFNISDFKGFNLDYLGSTEQPSITQLQPVQNNNDPLHISIGNPALKPSSSNNISFSYHSLSPIMLSTGFSIRLTSNIISTKTYTDSLGRQISQTVNSDGAFNSRVFIYLNKRSKPLDMDFGISTDFTYGRNTSFVNSLQSINNNYNGSVGVSINKNVLNRFHFQVNSNASFSYAKSSINNGAITKYWTQSHIIEGGISLFSDFELNSDLNIMWRQKTSQFDNNNQTIMWNMFISKLLLKNRVTIICKVNDILNQNAGISRDINANQITQSVYNVIGRYYMLLITYRFVKKL